jgi:diguanylate cyclase (GGDEF)-like protein
MKASEPSVRARILFVDDDPVVSLLFARSMRARGVVVDCCERGEQALQMALEIPYALVVSDLMLPDLDGASLATRIGAVQPQTKCLLVTGAPPEAWPSTLSVRGALRVVRKPWDDDVLYGEVAGALRAAQEIVLSESPWLDARPIVLVVDERPACQTLVRSALAIDHANYEVRSCGTVEEARALLTHVAPVAILIDHAALRALPKLQTAAPKAAIVVLSDEDDESAFVEALQDGAQDYLSRGSADGAMIRRSVRYAVERKRVEERLRYVAHHDVLTGAYSKQHLCEYLDEAIEAARNQARSVGLLYVDLVEFRGVIDRLGYAEADRIMQEVSRRLLDSIRAGDLLARVSDGGFAIAVTGSACYDAILSIAHRVRSALATPFVRRDERIMLSTDMGVAFAPDDAESGEALLGHGLAATRRTKQGEDGIGFYDASEHERLQRRIRLRDDLERGVQEEAFQVHFQPQVELRSGAMIGAEALLRFSNRAGQGVSPIEFIPLLEESGLILPVGAWVLRQVVQPFAQWQALTVRPLRVSVNVSSRQLRDRRFVEAVRELVSGTDGAWLELEITESVLLDNPSAPALLEEIAGLGVRLAIDDFGTGYSSLSYLARFPFHCLKIDRQFVDRMLVEPRVGAIVEATVNLGRTLGVEIVAEGVETETQRARLIEVGCVLGQGYLFARPQPAAALLTLLRDGSSGLAAAE